MEEKLLAETEGHYIRQTFTLGHFAVVMLQIYTIDAEEVVFENHCTPEQLPKEFVDFVKKGVHDFATESGISGILVCLADAMWHQTDSMELDFSMAAIMALQKVFSKKQ